MESTDRIDHPYSKDKFLIMIPISSLENRYYSYLMDYVQAAFSPINYRGEKSKHLIINMSDRNIYDLPVGHFEYSNGVPALYEDLTQRVTPGELHVISGMRGDNRHYDSINVDNIMALKYKKLYEHLRGKINEWQKHQEWETIKTIELCNKYVKPLKNN